LDRSDVSKITPIENEKLHIIKCNSSIHYHHAHVHTNTHFDVKNRYNFIFNLNVNHVYFIYVYVYQYFNIIAGPIFVKRMLKRIVYVPIKVLKKKQ